MKPELKARLFRTTRLCVIALLIGACIAFAQIRSENARVSNVRTITDAQQAVPGVQIGGPFTLTDQNGNVVTEKSYSGQYKLVYFGFTMCPMICPTGLQKIAKTLDQLGSAGEKIQPILISVDPERDRPDVLKQYVQQFHPRLVGLTGPKADIESVEKSYRVFASKVEDSNMSDYTMDHSSFTYLMSPDDKLIALYRDGDTVETMAVDIKNKIN